MSDVKPLRLARFVAAAELPVILAIAPALLFPTPRRLLVLCVVPILWCCARVTSGSFIPRTPMNASLGLLLAMVGVSLYATFDIRFSLGKVSGVLLGALVFWAIARWVTTADRLKMGTAAFVLAGAGLALLGLLGTHHGEFNARGSWDFNWRVVIHGVPGAEDGFNPNPVAGCLVLFVPLQFALLATDARRSLFPLARTARMGNLPVVIQASLLVLTAGTLLLMRSRSAFLGVLVAGVAIIAWSSRRARFVTVVAAGAAVVLAVAVGPQVLIRQAVIRSGPAMAATVASRVALWSRAIAGIKDFPLTGMGMNVARTVLPVVPPVKDIAHAHNHLLQAALDLGIPGLVAYISIWLHAAVLLVIVGRRAVDPIYRAMAAGLGAGLIAHFVFGLTDAIPLGAKVGVVFWLTLALTVALHRVSLAGQPA